MKRHGTKWVQACREMCERQEREATHGLISMRERLDENRPLFCQDERMGQKLGLRFRDLFSISGYRDWIPKKEIIEQSFDLAI